jgi:hypothetical protein
MRDVRKHHMFSPIEREEQFKAIPDSEESFLGRGNGGARMAVSGTGDRH